MHSTLPDDPPRQPPTSVPPPLRPGNWGPSHAYPPLFPSRDCEHGKCQCRLSGLACEHPETISQPSRARIELNGINRATDRLENEYMDVMEGTAAFHVLVRCVYVQPNPSWGLTGLLTYDSQALRARAEGARQSRSSIEMSTLSSPGWQWSRHPGSHTSYPGVFSLTFHRRYSLLSGRPQHPMKVVAPLPGSP